MYKSMIRILIADDEKMIRKRLKQCLPWEEIGYEVVGTASDGEELLEQILELRADVVLTDIKMPGMDGLEVIKKVKELGLNDIKFVIISGYSDFEYARKGIEFGVFDYVLKPIDKERLIESFKKLAAEVKKIKETRKEHISRIIKEKNVSSEFNLSGALIRVYKDELPRDKSEDARGVIIMCMDEILMDYCIIDETYEYITVFYETTSQKILEKLVFELFYCANDAVTNISDNSAISIYYTKILTKGDYVIKSINLFDKLRKQRAYIGKRRLLDADEINTEDKPNGNFVIDKTIERNIEKYISSRNFNGIRSLFSELPLEELTYNNARTVCFLFVNTLYRYLNVENDATTEEKDIISEFLHKFEICEFIETMRQCTTECIEKIFGLSSDKCHTETSRENYIIRKAMAYIDENLDRDISLKDVAENFEISYGYISRLFNLSYSGGFVSILRQKRIEIAKKMLTDTNKKIYEIAYATGFKNGRYFSEVFKNEVGITPQEYRKNNT